MRESDPKLQLDLDRLVWSESLVPESHMLHVGEFHALHFADKLRLINPYGRLGILTLWSQTDFIEDKLREIGVDLNPATSKIAVIGNLYGNGIPHLLRNLLYNPQIRDLIVCGANRSGSQEELIAFFENGLEETTSLGETVTRIKGTAKIIDSLVQPSCFAERPRLVSVGDLRDGDSRDKMRKAIEDLCLGEPLSCQRIEVTLPEVKVSHYPSEVRSHVVTRDTPLEAWRELVFRLHRFGHIAHLPKGDRQELQNVKVVICHPREDDAADLAAFGFVRKDLRQYQKDMLAPERPADQSYTYGNRMRSYYGQDLLALFAKKLKRNPEDRDCLLSLWDSHHDATAEHAPCLCTLFFRTYDEALTLTATYRAHNALDAWLKNIYGLMKAQSIVASKASLPVGAITVISHSISIDPSKYDLAERVAKAKGFTVDIDHNGQFMVSVDRGASEVVVQHLSDEGLLLHEYRSKHAERIQHELARDCAISDINHAIYLGRQLAKAEACLATGEAFEEG